MAVKRNLLAFKPLGKRSLGRARRKLEVSIAIGLEKLDREDWTLADVEMSQGFVPRRGSFFAVLLFRPLLMLL
jgi:hypothetical protein